MSTLPNISNHYHIIDGFCYPDWEAISKIIEDDFPQSEWNTTWEFASKNWLKLIQENLGDNYQIHETPNFLVLSEAPQHIIKQACRSYENSLRQILDTFEGVASDEGFGKHVVMMFASLEDYYGYISHFYPEGENPMSGGVCLDGGGYVHFAFPTPDYSSYQCVLVHELTHGCLGHLPIPTWINEALAMRMEQVICGSDNFYLDQELYNKHTDHWNPETIQQFWTGESWGIAGDSFELSYNLAQILWRKIEVDLAAPHAKILQFVSEAHFEDGGEFAFRTIFNLSLGVLVEDFLGEGIWSPEPKKWPTNEVS